MRPRPAWYPQNFGWPEPARPVSLAGKRQQPAGFLGESEAETLYDPSFLGAYGRLRQQEMLADAQRRAAQWKAEPARAGRREQRPERRRYSLRFWRSAARIRREQSESALQPNFGISICVGCAGGENVNPTASNQPPRAQGVEVVVFEPGPASQRDIVESLVQIRRPDLGAGIDSVPSRALRHRRLGRTSVEQGGVAADQAACSRGSIWVSGRQPGRVRVTWPPPRRGAPRGAGPGSATAYAAARLPGRSRGGGQRRACRGCRVRVP